MKNNFVSILGIYFLKNYTTIFYTSIIYLCMMMNVYAQAGHSSGSMGRTRNNPSIPKPSEVVVEEFMNYHLHNLPLPEKNEENVKIDLRWGNEKPKENKNILQIGFTTAKKNSNDDIMPMNICLVIDNSGSMAEFNKLERVKTALKTFVKQLRPTDVLSIVKFSSDAQTIIPAQRVETIDFILQKISEIRTEGGTNINAGLMLGFKEVEKRINMKEYAHRVILLTDGIASAGITNPNQIIENSKTYIDKGIYLSTMGVGSNVQQEMLTNLAKKGKGQSHFLGDEEDVEKVFMTELQSLFSPVAENVKVEIELPQKFMMTEFYGYEHKQKANQTIRINIDNMNNGLTQIMLLEGYLTEKIRENIVVNISYYDVKKKKNITQTHKIKIPFSKNEEKELIQDTANQDYFEGYDRFKSQSFEIKDKEVRKNYVITKLANAIKRTTELTANGQKQKALKLNEGNLHLANEYYGRDADVMRVVKILKGYQDVLLARGGSSDD